MDDLININDEIIKAEEVQLAIIRNPKIYLLRINPFEAYDAVKFRQIYRINKQLAQSIIDMDSADITVSRRGGGISPSLQVLATIRYLAKGAYEQDIGDMHGISQPSLSRVIHRVVTAIASHREQFIRFPQGLQLEIAKADFYELGQCPNIVGAIDGTHIKIKCPGGENPLLYINRKGFYSLNVQVVCDAKLRIRDIVARWRGSTHDSRIWNNCSLRNKFENGQIDGILLGDNGYACTTYLLTPVLNPANNSEINYNTSHIRTRNVVERVFGCRKNKFRCFINGLQISLPYAKAAIIALAVIHNMYINDKLENHIEEEDDFFENQDQHLIQENEPAERAQRNVGQLFRRQYIERYFNN